MLKHAANLAALGAGVICVVEAVIVVHANAEHACILMALGMLLFRTVRD